MTEPWMVRRGKTAWSQEGWTHLPLTATGQERLMLLCVVVALNYSQARWRFVPQLQESHAS